MSDPGERDAPRPTAGPEERRLVLDPERRVSVRPLRLESPGAGARADLDRRIEALRRAIEAGGTDRVSRTSSQSPARNDDPLRSEESEDEDLDDLVARTVRAELSAALDERLEDFVRLIVRREVARALSARRRT